MLTTLALAAVTLVAVFALGPLDSVLWVCGALWVANLVYQHFSGHHMFNTRSNVDLMIAIAGLGIVAAIVTPRFVEARACRSARTALSIFASAEEGYLSEHGKYVTDLSQLPLVLPAGVTIGVTQDMDGRVRGKIVHPRCPGGGLEWAPK